MAELTADMCLVAWLGGLALAADEHAPHVLLIVDPELGPGPATGPIVGAVNAMVHAERLQTSLNEENDGAPVRVEVVRLYGLPRR